MEKELEVGNVIVVRDYEPQLRMMGVVTYVGEGGAVCIMLTTRLNRLTGLYQFSELEVEYDISLNGTHQIEVVSLPSEVLA